jgi:protein-tyrosine phosphatase
MHCQKSSWTTAPNSNCQKRHLFRRDGPYTYLRKLPSELVAPLMRSDPAYIESVLDHIDATYGSVDAYIQQELGVDETQLAALQQKLLED